MPVDIARTFFRTLHNIFLIAGFAIVSVTYAGNLQEIFIESNKDFKRAQRLLDDSTAESVIIRVKSGDYRLRDTFHINRSNVTLQGESDVRLRLANRAQVPVLAIGPQSRFPSDEERVSNISISDLIIDGNKDKQSSEYHRKLPWIRNNAIDVRVATKLTVERVVCQNARSGGLVISWRCRDIVARDCVFENSYFDGVAYYDSSNVSTIDCVMRGNEGAGASLDNAFVDSLFVRCKIVGNQDVGVFVRDSQRLVFFQCYVQESGNWAFFLSHDDREKGVFDIDIASCEIESNNGGVCMGSISESQSSRNSITATRFGNNDRFGRSDFVTAGSEILLFNEAWSPDAEAGADIASDTPSPYSRHIYQALLDVDNTDRI